MGGATFWEGTADRVQEKKHTNTRLSRRTDHQWEMEGTRGTGERRDGWMGVRRPFQLRSHEPEIAQTRPTGCTDSSESRGLNVKSGNRRARARTVAAVVASQRQQEFMSVERRNEPCTRNVPSSAHGTKYRNDADE